MTILPHMNHSLLADATSRWTVLAGVVAPVMPNFQEAPIYSEPAHYRRSYHEANDFGIAGSRTEETDALGGVPPGRNQTDNWLLLHHLVEIASRSQRPFFQHAPEYRRMVMKALAFFLAVASVLLNVALLTRLHYIAQDNRSYVLNPENGLVWQLDTHAEFQTWMKDSWLPYWIRPPIRGETKDSLVLLGHLTPITKECDWRRFEKYRKLQQTCFHDYDFDDAEMTTIIYKSTAKISQKFIDHPVVALVAKRIVNQGIENESPKLLVPIEMTIVGTVSRLEGEQPEPKAAVLFRGWAARNFEVATGMLGPTWRDSY